MQFLLIVVNSVYFISSINEDEELSAWSRGPGYWDTVEEGNLGKFKMVKFKYRELQ